MGVYTGNEWEYLLRQMNAREVKRAIKVATRAEAKTALSIARRYLRTSGLRVKGNTSDWEKGLRVFNYKDGGGFLVTVKPRRANWKGKGEKSMHENRRGLRKPVLMWAEDGTVNRRTKDRGFFRKKGHNTGRMPAFRVLDKATLEMFRKVEQNLTPAIGAAVEKVAKKCGFT